MIFYIFNYYFPDNGGFAKRCLKEIEILSKYFKIIIICRARNSKDKVQILNVKNNNVNIFYFSTYFNSSDSILLNNEITRTLGVLINLTITLIKIFNKYKNYENKLLYTVVSPLTIPIISLICSKFFKIKPSILEFHDLEPEMAIHIKKLNKSSIILKIEYLLEKYACKYFQHIIVTTEKQKEILKLRNNIPENNISVIYNSIHASLDNSDNLNEVTISNNTKYKIGLISSFSYDYTINGLISLVSELNNNKNAIKNFLFIVVGDGEQLIKVKNLVKKYELSKHFLFTGKVSNVKEWLNTFDVTIIPWELDTMSNNILPTKLFEYMLAHKPIIAPNFGEFEKLLTHKKNAILFNNINEIIPYLHYLNDNNTKSKKLGIESYNLFSNLNTEKKYKKIIKNILK